MGFYRLIGLILLGGFLLWPLPAGAEGLVAGHYGQGVGSELEIILEIGSPPPPLVIVSQNLPLGTRVLSATPKLKKYDPDTGKAKWLLSKVNSGKMTISLRLDRPVARGQISGEIMSRSGGGKMVSVALGN